MTFDQLVPSKSDYLKKEDVGEDGVILTIKGFKYETLETDNGGEEQKLAMFFQEEDYKPMIVNRTNAQLLQVATGSANAGEAKGKKIIVYNDASISFGGKVTGGLRIKKIAGAPKPATGVMTEADFDDQPF